MGGGIKNLFAMFAILTACADTSIAAAQCTPGEQVTVTACDHIDATASYGERNTNSCTYNPPPGYVIFNHRVIENSNNNGGKSVAIPDGGAEFATSTDFEAAKKEVSDLLGQYTDEKGQNVYRAKLDTAYNNFYRYSRSYSTNKNTLYLEVAASGHGHMLDRKRGWIDVTIEADLLCIGYPEQSVLAQNLKDAINLPDPSKNAKIATYNNCDRKISVALVWRRPSGTWDRAWWYNVDPKDHAYPTLKRDNGMNLITNHDTLYAYAEAGTYKWRGKDDEKQHYDITIDNETYRLARRYPPLERGYRKVEFTCEN